MAKKKDALVRLYAFILLGQMTTSFLLSTMISHFGERTLMRISAVLLPAILPAAASAGCAGHSAVEYLFGAVTPIIYGKFIRFSGLIVCLIVFSTQLLLLVCFRCGLLRSSANMAQISKKYILLCYRVDSTLSPMAKVDTITVSAFATRIAIIS